MKTTTLHQALSLKTIKATRIVLALQVVAFLVGVALAFVTSDANAQTPDEVKFANLEAYTKEVRTLNTKFDALETKIKNRNNAVLSNNALYAQRDREYASDPTKCKDLKAVISKARGQFFTDFSADFNAAFDLFRNVFDLRSKYTSVAIGTDTGRLITEGGFKRFNFVITQNSSYPSIYNATCSTFGAH